MVEAPDQDRYMVLGYAPKPKIMNKTQRWFVQRAGRGYQLKNCQFGTYLAIQNTNLGALACTSEYPMTWVLHFRGSDTFLLQVPGNDRVLNLRGGSKDEGATINIASAEATREHRKWRFEFVSAESDAINVEALERKLNEKTGELLEAHRKMSNVSGQLYQREIVLRDQDEELHQKDKEIERLKREIAERRRKHVTNNSRLTTTIMDEWGSVWATPTTAANPPAKPTSPSEEESDLAAPTTSHTQTLSFVDDAFDDKSGPPTPAFPSAPKPTAPKFANDDAFDVNDDGFGPPADDGFGDFDDFAAPASGQALDDDFGDFGDFGNGDVGGGFEAGPSNGFGDGVHDGLGQGGFGMEDVKASARWQPLEVDPLPPPQEAIERVGELLRPIWAHLQPDEFLSDEPERQVEGIAQILVTPGSRALYGLLTQQPRSSSRPPNWTRSRIRRQHLISLGIPINLDEVLPQSTLKPLPVLHIQTEAAHQPRPLSAPPGPRPSPGEQLSRVTGGTGSARGSRTGTPAGSPISSSGRRLPPTATSALRLGPKPQVDNKKIEESLSLTSDNLSLLPLAQLESHLATMRTLTTSTSTLLTHLLQQREALQQDSETYNGLIAELVGEAQKMKSSGSRGRAGTVKRGSLM
ncbi:hypothetical protein FRC07_002672 [Ceratobasidium sp. 392]|nr:hypothetical protein FRC07_002672 [Ceratobasidium sp. 392]